MAKFGNVAGDQLRAVIERIEKLEEEKANIAVDIREVYAEAKGNGYDTKVLRAIIKLRKLENNEREEQEYLLDTYLRAIGMLPAEDEDEPLVAAIKETAPIGHNSASIYSTTAKE